MEIHTADVTEAAALTGIVNLAFQVERYFIDGNRTDVRTIQNLFAGGTFLAAYDGPVLIGCVYVELRGEGTGRRGYIGMLAVDPSRQQSGLGSRLMSAAEDYIAAQGCLIAELRIVNIRPELPSFYRKRGYAESGTEPFHSASQPKIPCHFVTMSKPLKATDPARQRTTGA